MSECSKITVMSEQVLVRKSEISYNCDLFIATFFSLVKLFVLMLCFPCMFLFFSLLDAYSHLHFYFFSSLFFIVFIVFFF